MTYTRGVSYIEPALPLLLVLIFIGLIRAWRTSATHEKPWLLTFGSFGILFLSLNPVAWLLSRPLQMPYDGPPVPRESADAIVVLSGGFDPAATEHPYGIVSEDTYRRLEHAAWLFKSWSTRPVLTCGGGKDFATAMRHVLEAEGIPSGSIWTEIGSRSTRENAVNCREILKEHNASRIALVVDASSMWRASACFTKLGITVVPAPSEFDTFGIKLLQVLPTWKAIRSNGLTAHELLGLLWYRLRGWI